LVTVPETDQIACDASSSQEELDEIGSSALVAASPWHLELSPDGSKLYAASGLTNEMTVIDTETFKAEKSVPVGRLP